MWRYNIRCAKLNWCRDGCLSFERNGRRNPRRGKHDSALLLVVSADLPRFPHICFADLSAPGSRGRVRRGSRQQRCGAKLSVGGGARSGGGSVHLLVLSASEARRSGERRRCPREILRRFGVVSSGVGRLLRDLGLCVAVCSQ